MNSDPIQSVSAPDSLSEVLAALLEAAEQHEVIDREAWLSRYPQYQTELAEFFDSLENLAPWITPLRSVARALRPSHPPMVHPATGTGSAVPVRILGNYELLEEIGRGGMGIVYKARQKSLKRLVALKMVRPSLLATADDLRRFRKEAEATANLDHPNIVAVHEVGEQDGQPYFSMKLIEGTSLDRCLAPFTADPKAAARLVAQIARAVHHAHQHGVLHRDLKPSNILLDRDGRPHVTDFGLAKRLEGDSDLTQSGVLLGSPSYMAPEQAAGRRGAVTTATDVYGLGALLYTLLTGQPPFTGNDPFDILTRVREREPAHPSSHNLHLHRDLETICLKCLDKEPSRRYASAEELARDLEHWLAGEPILARPLGSMTRTWRWCRRKPGLAGAIGLAAFLFLGLIASLVIGIGAVAKQNVLLHQQKANAEQQRDLVNAERLRVLQRERALRERAYVADMGEAYRIWQTSVSGLADQWAGEILARWLPGPGQEDLRGFEWHLLKTQIDAGRNCRLTLRGHHSDVYQVAFAPSGKLLASASQDGTVRLWDAASGHLLRTLRGHTNEVNAVAFSPDSRLVASASEDGTVRFWTVATGASLAICRGHVGEVVGIAFAPDGRWVASCGNDGMVRIWTVPAGRASQTWQAAPVRLEELAYAPDGRSLVTVDFQHQVKIWNLRAQPPSAKALPGEWETIAFSPDGQTLATGGWDHPVTLWRTRTWERFKSFGHDLAATRTLAFAPSGLSLAAANDTEVWAWDLSTGVVQQHLHGHGDRVWSLAFSPDGRTMATGSRDQTVRLWDVGVPRAGRKLPIPTSVATIALSRDGTKLAAFLQPNSITVWDPSAGHLLRRFPGDGSRVLLFTPDDRNLLFERPEHTLVLCDLDGKVKRSLRPRESNLLPGNTALWPDGQWLAVSEGESHVEIWNLADRRVQGRVPHSPSTHFGSLAVSPDGRTLAVGQAADRRQDRGQARFWDLDAQAWRGRPFACFRETMHYAPDGKVLATAGGSAIFLHDAATGAGVATLFGHHGGIMELTFSPDGKTLVTGNGDGTITLWNMATRQELFTLDDGARGPIKELALSADGKLLISLCRPAGGPGEAFAWDADEERSTHK